RLGRPLRRGDHLFGARRNGGCPAHAAFAARDPGVRGRPAMNRLAFAVLATLHATSLPAQDLRRLAPQSPPPVQAPADRPAPSAAASVSEDAILLPRLNGLVFLARPEQVAEPAHLDE